MKNKGERKDRTAVKSCTCVHPYQDQRYGNGKRLMNSTQKEDAGGQVFRCTVCGREHV